MDSEMFAEEFERTKQNLDKRLAGRHIRALADRHKTSIENDKLRHRVSELEGYKMKADYYYALEQQVYALQNELSKCDTLHALGRNVEENMKAIKEEYIKAFYDYQEDMENKLRLEVEKISEEHEKQLKIGEEERVQRQAAEGELRENKKILEKQVEASAVMKRNMDKLVEEFDKTVASFAEIKAKNEELQLSQKKLKELCKKFQAENVSLQEELEDSLVSRQKLKKDMNKMVMKITRYIKQIRDLETVKNTSSRLEFEKGWLTHLHEKTTSELSNLQIKHKDTSDQLQLVSQERNLLRRQLSSLQCEVDRLQEELDSSQFSFSEFLELKKQVCALREENEILVKRSKTFKLRMLKPDCKMGSQTRLVPINVKSR